MSIEGKHAYRFGYLKSDNWSNVRLEALAREGAKCQVCFEESLSNDAHHMWYPENIWETRSEQLVILCRGCHDFIHSLVPDCKTNDENEGRAYWLRFYNAIVAWRASKIVLFTTTEGLKLKDPVELRKELERLKNRVVSNVARDSISKGSVGKMLTRLKEVIEQYSERFELDKK